MQTTQFTYDELTPLEQCIIDFMARQQESKKKRETAKRRNRQALVEA